MKFVCFGEIMARFYTPEQNRFVQARNMELCYGGDEANVAVSLAGFGKDAMLVTKLPDNALARSALRDLKAHDVDVSAVAFGGERMGLCFWEKGAALRPSRVIYDRKYSSIATAKKEDFDWKKIFSDAEWFHFTGVTPALSDTCAELCLEACRVAKGMGITVSCDLSYQKDLWTRERAGQVMSALMSYVDVVIAGEEDCELIFDIKGEDADVAEGEGHRTSCRREARELSERFDIPTVAIMLYEHRLSHDATEAAMLYNHGEYFFSRRYPLYAVDGGDGRDSFCAGLIRALSEGMDNGTAVEFAMAASALKHTISGHFNEVSVAEVMEAMSGDGCGRGQG